MIPTGILNLVKHIDNSRSKQNWVDALVMRILFEEHLHETKDSLYSMDMNSLLDLGEELEIRAAVQKQWQKEEASKDKS